MAYAASTSVPAGKSRVKIEDLVRAKGAKRIGTMRTHDSATVAFELNGYAIRFTLPMPTPENVRNPKKKEPEALLRRRVDQLERTRWRALLLCIKAKFEAIESGIEVFEEAFMSHINVPGSGTVADDVIPKLEAMRSGRAMPPLLAESNP
jgi:hypothetical protein